MRSGLTDDQYDQSHDDDTADGTDEVDRWSHVLPELARWIESVISTQLMRKMDAPTITASTRSCGRKLGPVGAPNKKAMATTASGIETTKPMSSAIGNGDDGSPVQCWYEARSSPIPHVSAEAPSSSQPSRARP